MRVLFIPTTNINIVKIVGCAENILFSLCKEGVIIHPLEWWSPSHRVCATGMGLILAVTENTLRKLVYQERWEGLPCVAGYVTFSSPTYVGFGDGGVELCKSLEEVSLLYASWLACGMGGQKCTYDTLSRLTLCAPYIILQYVLNQQDAQISVIKLYFLIRCSSCFGLY